MESKNVTNCVIRYERVIFPLLFALLIAIIYAPVVFFGKTLIPTSYYPDGITGQTTHEGREAVNSFNIDLATPAYFESPINRLVGDMYLNGQIPLWNPYQASGTPLAAQYSTRAFFPYQILEDISPYWLWDYFILLRLWIAGFFTFLFLRALFLSRQAAFLGGVFYMFSGAMVWFINLEQMVNVAMLIPLLMFAFEKMISTFRPAYSMLSIASVAMVLLAGNPEVAAYVLLLSGLYALLRIWMIAQSGQDWVAGISRLIVASFLGLGFAAPLLIPFLDYTSYGHHVHPAGGPVGMGKVHLPAWAMGIFTPTFFEMPTWQRWPPINGVWDFLGGYCGVLPLFVAITGWLKGRCRKLLLLFFGAFGLVILLKNFGVPPFLWLGHLPLLDQVWSPRWAGPVWTFCFAIAGALGFEALQSQSPRLEPTVKSLASPSVQADPRTGQLKPAVSSKIWNTMNNWLGGGLVIAGIAVNRITLEVWLSENLHIGSASSLVMLSIFQIAAVAAGYLLLFNQRPAILTRSENPGVHRSVSSVLWWLPLLAIFSAVVVATNFPGLLTDTHPLTPKPSWPAIIPYLASSVWIGGLVACTLLALAIWAMSQSNNRPNLLNAIIPLAIIEAWFLIPRGYEALYLSLKLIPVLAAVVAVIFFIRGRRLLPLSLAVIAVFSTFALDLASPHGFPDRKDPFHPTPYVEFLKENQTTNLYRVMATDGVLMPNFASALGLYDVRYMNTLVLEDYLAFTKNLSGQEWRKTDASSVVFSGRPEVVPEIPQEKFGYSIAKIPAREAFSQNTRYYSLLGVRYLVVPLTHEFIYTDGFGDWVAVDLPNWTSGIDSQDVDSYLKDSQTTGTWRREGTHLGVFSDTPQSLIYKFVFEEPIRSGFLHFWFSIRENGGSAQVYVSPDGSKWGSPILSISDVHEQFMKRVDLPPSLQGNSNTLFIKITGWTPSKNDSVSLKQWGIWLEFDGDKTPFRYVIDGNHQRKIQSPSALPLVYDNEVRIYENTEALPRYFITHNIKRVSSPEEAWFNLQNPDIDMRYTTFVEEYIPGLDIDSTYLSNGGDLVKLVTYQPNRVVLEVKTKTPGILVLNDTFSPRWEALVDGQRTKIFRVNGLVRGVFVSPGEHTVVFQYWPKGFILGLIVAVLSLLGSIAWFVSESRRRQNPAN